MSTTRRILITGANKGIGKATVAAVLSAHDDTEVLLGSRDAARGEAARTELLTAHPEWEGRLAVVEIDVSDYDSIIAAAQVVGERFPDDEYPLYAIVNNAGVGLGDTAMADVLEVNTYGPRRVCETFIPYLDPTAGRIVNVSSASGPVFVAGCDAEHQELLTKPAVTWSEVEALMNECLEIAASGGDFAAAGLGEGSAYGLSKACLNAYTIALARTHPEFVVNACTPGFIETDLTRPFAAQKGSTPADMGMKPPEEGTRAAMRLLFGDPGGSGWYFGSDAERSPLDRYRGPGDPPYAPK